MSTTTQTTTPSEPLIIPPPSNVEKTFSPKIETIVSAISQLNLLEVSELSDALKKRLNLPDAPLMPAGGFVAAAPAEDEEEVAPKVVRFSSILKEYTSVNFTIDLFLSA